MPVIAAANPVDPSWQTGLYDDAGTDQLVVQTLSPEAMVELGILILVCLVTRRCPVDEGQSEHTVWSAQEPVPRAPPDPSHRSAVASAALSSIHLDRIDSAHVRNQWHYLMCTKALVHLDLPDGGLNVLSALIPGSRQGAVAVGLTLVALISAGCGGSHHSSPSDLSISDLRVFQNPATHVLALQATFVDHDGDLFNGTCNISTNLGAVSIPIDQLAPGIAPNAITGPVSCVIQFRSGLTGTPLSGNMFVTDAAGHVSNALPFTTTIPELTRGRSSADVVASLTPEFARIGH